MSTIRIGDDDNYCEVMHCPDDKTLLITALHVSPNRRRSGVGTQLIKQAIVHGKSLACEQIECIVDDTPQAMAFWRSISKMKISTYYGMCRGQLLLKDM